MTHKEPYMPALLTTKDVARLLAVTPARVDQLVGKHPNLVKETLSGGDRIYSPTEVAKLKASMITKLERRLAALRGKEPAGRK